MEAVTAPHKSKRCPLCFYALYDGDWCLGKREGCEYGGKSVPSPVMMTNEEAAEAIRKAKEAGNYPL